MYRVGCKDLKTKTCKKGTCTAKRRYGGDSLPEAVFAQEWMDGRAGEQVAGAALVGLVAVEVVVTRV